MIGMLIVGLLVGFFVGFCAGMSRLPEPELPNSRRNCGNRTSRRPRAWGDSYPQDRGLTMIVKTSQRVDVDVEYDVSLEDCINELIEKAEDDEASRLQLSAVDGATKILARVTPAMVERHIKSGGEGYQLIRQRLQAWIDATQPPGNW